MDPGTDAPTDAVAEMISLLVVARVCVDRGELSLALETVGVESLGSSIPAWIMVYPPNVNDDRCALWYFLAIYLVVYMIFTLAYPDNSIAAESVERTLIRCMGEPSWCRWPPSVKLLDYHGDVGKSLVVSPGWQSGLVHHRINMRMSFFLYMRMQRHCLA